jgi:prevent-host-death family protein
MTKPIHVVDINKAANQLSKLVDQSAKGEPFIIAKVGEPLVKVTAIDAPAPAKKNTATRLYARADFGSGRFRPDGPLRF